MIIGHTYETTSCPVCDGPVPARLFQILDEQALDPFCRRCVRMSGTANGQLIKLADEMLAAYMELHDAVIESEDHRLMELAMRLQVSAIAYGKSFGP